MSGGLPPGVTDADIDKAAPGYDEPPFYCAVYRHPTWMHCADAGHGQCRECQEADTDE